MAPTVYLESEGTNVESSEGVETPAPLAQEDLVPESASGSNNSRAQSKAELRRRYMNLIYTGNCVRSRRLRRIVKYHADLMGVVVKNINDTPDAIQRSAINGGTVNGDDTNNVNDEDESILNRRELLLDITLRTMVLLHHNQQLQDRLTALQTETRNYVQSLKKAQEDSTDNSVEKSQSQKEN